MTNEAKEFAERVVEVVTPDPWVRRLLALLGVALVVALVVGMVGLYSAIRVSARANEQAARTIERLEASQTRSSETIDNLEAEVGELREQVAALQEQVRDLGGVPIGTPTDVSDGEDTAATGRAPPDDDAPTSAAPDEDPDPEPGQGPSSSPDDPPPTVPDGPPTIGGEVCVGSTCVEIPEVAQARRDSRWTRTREREPRSPRTNASTSTRAKGPTPPKADPTTTSPTSTTTPATSSRSSGSPRAHPNPEAGRERLPVGAVDRRDRMHRRP